MEIDVHLICVSAKAKYFLFRGLTFKFRLSELICLGFAKGYAGRGPSRCFVAPAVIPIPVASGTPQLSRLICSSAQNAAASAVMPMLPPEQIPPSTLIVNASNAGRLL